MQRVLLAALLAFTLLFAAGVAQAGGLSSTTSVYMEYEEDEKSLVASRTINWEIWENWHLTLSADVIYRYVSLTELHRLATGLDVSGTRYWGNTSFTLGHRIRSDRTPGWYFLMTISH